jgi:hypothetical protein
MSWRSNISTYGFRGRKLLLTSGGSKFERAFIRTLLKRLALLTALAVCAANTVAQTYSINGHTLGGGGGSSAGGTYSIRGTLGQQAAGRSTAGEYSVSDGFWSLIGSVPTPGAPLLSLCVTGTNTVIVSWPSPSTGFVLQQNRDGTGAQWTDVGLAQADNGTTKSVVIRQPMGNLFFRLKK